jgi:3-dehydroquinate dehydratase-2
VRIAVLQGPNLNRLGTRSPKTYGTTTLPEVQQGLDEFAEAMGWELQHFQSNHEGQLIDWLQSLEGSIDGVLCNPAGLTTYGISLRDALNECGVPVGIIHLSNIHAREPWRRHDVFADIASVYLAGAKSRGYQYALQALVGIIKDARP